MEESSGEREFAARSDGPLSRLKDVKSNLASSLNLGERASSLASRADGLLGDLRTSRSNIRFAGADGSALDLGVSNFDRGAGPVSNFVGRFVTDPAEIAPASSEGVAQASETAASRAKHSGTAKADFDRGEPRDAERSINDRDRNHGRIDEKRPSQEASSRSDRGEPLAKSGADAGTKAREIDRELERQPDAGFAALIGTSRRAGWQSQ